MDSFVHSMYLNLVAQPDSCLTIAGTQRVQNGAPTDIAQPQGSTRLGGCGFAAFRGLGKTQPQ